MRTMPLHVAPSRRSLLRLGAAFLLMPRRAFGQDAIAAATDASQHLTVAVTLDGKGPFRFVIDTGADRSVIADSVAEALGVPRHGKVLVEGLVRTVPAETVHVDRLTFGQFSHTDIELPVLPRRWLAADGYLGLDVIDRYRVTLDFAKRRLLIEPPRSVWVREGSVSSTDGRRVPLVGEAGHLRSVNGWVDGVRTVVFVDTGAEASMGNRALLDALRARNPESYLRSRSVKIAGVTGGEVEGQMMDFSRARIGGLILEHGTVAIADLQIFDLWRLADRPALLIGMNFLRQFARVTIDFGRKEYRFKVSRLFVAQNNA